MDETPTRRLRIATYNVHACIGTDGDFAPQRIADVLASLDADFIALQEVEDREYRGRTVSEFLEKALGLTAAARTTHKRKGLDYGNLLLSRAAPKHTASHDLAVPGREPRAAIDARFDIDGCSLQLLVSHFGLSLRERRVQLQKILLHLETLDADLTVLCADFNEWLPYSRLHRELRRVLGSAPAVRTFPSRLTALSLDRIYAAPLEALTSVETVKTREARAASDHLPVVAEFDLASLRC